MKEKKKDINKLFDIISGEKQLRDREKKIKEAKKQAIKDMKNKRRKEIIEKDVEMEKDPVQDRKVVQNIKLFEWESPDRYQIKFTNKNFLMIVALSLVLILLLAILKHYLMMISIIAVLFLLYVSGTTKPITIKSKITARGIESYDKLFEWYMLDSFYFCKKETSDYYSLIVDTRLNLPRVLFLICSKEDKDALFVLLQEKLMYKDIRKQGRIDKITYGEYIPLEKV
ncbi:MAG: hypothetical protein ACOX6Q_03975 [Candidatus Dojkabacteria bacterium]|jgi:hypothetical protein